MLRGVRDPRWASSTPSFNVREGSRQHEAGKADFPVPSLSGSFNLEQRCGGGRRGEMTDGLLGLFSPTVVLPGHDGAATPNLGGSIYQLSW